MHDSYETEQHKSPFELPLMYEPGFTNSLQVRSQTWRSETKKRAARGGGRSSAAAGPCRSTGKGYFRVFQIHLAGAERPTGRRRGGSARRRR